MDKFFLSVSVFSIVCLGLAVGRGMGSGVATAAMAGAVFGLAGMLAYFPEDNESHAYFLGFFCAASFAIVAEWPCLVNGSGEKRMKKLLIGMACALASLPCFAKDTWAVGGTGTKSAQIINVSAIETSGSIKETWVVAVFPRPTSGIDYIVFWTQFNCKTKKIRDTDRSVRRFNHGIVSTLPDGDWVRVEPGTVAEDTFSEVCKKPTTPYGLFDTIEEAAKGFRKLAFESGGWK